MRWNDVALDFMFVMLGLYLFTLSSRVSRLEKDKGQWADELVGFYNRLVGRFLRPRGVEIEDAARTIGGFKQMERLIGNKCFTQTPALRRVIAFEIAVTFDYLHEKTGVTMDDLPRCEEQWSAANEYRPMVFIPAESMVVEEWATHTVVIDFSGRPRTFYAAVRNSEWPLTLWSHSLPRTENSKSGHLEVVLWQGEICFWARGYRFDTSGRKMEPQVGNILVSIPLENTKMLEEVSDPLMQDTEELKEEYGETPLWIRSYGRDRPDEGFAWQLTVRDIVHYSFSYGVER